MVVKKEFSFTFNFFQNFFNRNSKHKPTPIIHDFNHFSINKIAHKIKNIKYYKKLKKQKLS